MKHFNRNILIALAVLVAGTVLCIIFAKNMENKTASMIGGALSAFSTMILGVIAFYQNVLYKHDTDRIYDITFMPEFFQLNNAIDTAEYGTQALMHTLSVLPTYESSQTGIQLGKFLCLHGPILNLVPIALYIEDKCLIKQFQDQDVFSINKEEGAFQIICSIPDEITKVSHNYSVIVEYENMYGMRYHKRVNFHVGINLNIDSLVLEKAARTKSE